MIWVVEILNSDVNCTWLMTEIGFFNILLMTLNICVFVDVPHLLILERYHLFDNGFMLEGSFVDLINLFGTKSTK